MPGAASAALDRRLLGKYKSTDWKCWLRSFSSSCWLSGLMKYFAAGFIVLLALFVAVFVRTEAGMGKRRLTYTMYKYELYDVFRRQSGRDFERKWNEAHPDDPISVRYEPIAGASYNVKLNAEAVAGTLQDVFIVPDFQEYVRRGVLLDLTPYVEKHNARPYLSEIYPALIDYHTIDGKFYGLPYNLNTRVLFYNRTLFDRDGMAYPTADWTWDDLLAAANKLTKRDARGRLIQAGLVPDQAKFWVLWNGGRYWNEDGTRSVINSPAALEAFRFYHDLQFKYRVCPTPSELRDVSGDVMFQNNRAAMLVGDRWWTSVFKNLGDVNWAVAPLPKSPAGRRPAYMAFISLGVNARTRHPDVAFSFLLHLTQPEQVKFLVDVGDSIPIRHGREANAEFLAEPGRPPGENEAYLMGMDDPIIYWGPETYSRHLPIEEQNNAIRRFDEDLGRPGADVEALVARLEAELNKLYAERTAPPRPPSIPLFLAVVGGMVAAVGLVVGLCLRSARAADG